MFSNIIIMFNTHLHLIIIKAQFCLLGWTPLLNSNIGNLTSDKDLITWSGDSMLGGRGCLSAIVCMAR